MKITILKEFIPLIATISALALISAVAYAARIESHSPTNIRQMQSESCSPSPSQSPTE